MSDTPWAAASGRIVSDAYHRELDALGAISTRPLFQSLLPGFADYGAQLKALAQNAAYQKQVRRLCADGTVDTSAPTPELVRIFCEAQIGACCEILQGRSLGAAQFNRDGMRLLAAQLAAPFAAVEPVPPTIAAGDYSPAQQAMMEAIHRIQNLDTIRVMQVVRLLGLMDWNGNPVRQLSLAAAAGHGDRYGIHALPRIVFQRSSGGDVIAFDTVARQAENLVLVDNDPVWVDHYARLNREQGILALNEDLQQAMAALAAIQEQKQFGARNLVLGLRIDHRMIPDAAGFLAQLAPLIEQRADLLLTIGAGHELAEFAGRVDCLDRLETALREAGLEPRRILLHGKGSLQEQRARPNFGNLEYATYQVLYCKLLRKKLDKFRT